MHNDTLHTPAETADKLRVTQRTLADWRYRGYGPRFVRLSGRAVRYRESDLDAFVDGRTVHSTSDAG
jgi:predicted DNA-binding transcriptional regulator AlpA